MRVIRGVASFSLQVALDGCNFCIRNLSNSPTSLEFLDIADNLALHQQEFIAVPSAQDESPWPLQPIK